MLQPQQSYQHPSIRKSYFEKKSSSTKKNRERLLKKIQLELESTTTTTHLCICNQKQQHFKCALYKISKPSKKKQDKIQELNKNTRNPQPSPLIR